MTEGLKGCLFVHSSQQREERTKKRRRSYRAFGLSLRSPSGSAELAPLKHSSPFSLRLVSLAASPPDKGGIGDCCFCLYSNPLCFINPSVLRPPPLYFAVQNTP